MQVVKIGIHRRSVEWGVLSWRCLWDVRVEVRCGAGLPVAGGLELRI